MLIIDEATLVPFDAENFKRPQQIMVIGDLFQIALPGSVFEVAAASGMQVFRLRRNFRASNCDIMTWSNIFSYNNALVVKNRGTRRSELRYVPLGRKQNGIVRAEAIAIANAARVAAGNGESVGIVAFNKKQLKAILDALQKADAPPIAFMGLPEEVQGKEADCVLVSLGAALTQSGRLPSDIAGLNDDQAIMKMNVALSRARSQTIVFSSLQPCDIDLRLANDAQALIASVLQTFERLPTQQQMDADPIFNRSVC
ncbi:AAA domain-containing protein [Brucella sp. TWI559]